MRAFWLYRSFIWKSALHELRHRYAGSVLGVFWNVITPLAQILIYTVVFSHVMKLRLPGTGTTHDFAIYLCSGLLPWAAFSDCILRGTRAFIENAAYLKKLPIPEQIFVAINVAVATLSLLISMSLLFVLVFFLGGGASVSWAWLSIPIVIVLLQSLGFGLGLLFGSINVFFRDMGQGVSILVQLWMWATPIVYVKDILPPGVQSWLPFNPAFPFIESLQQIVLYGVGPPGGHWFLMCFWALGAPLLGFLVLRSLRAEIRDLI